MKLLETKLFLLIVIIMVPVVLIYHDYFSGKYINQIILFTIPLLWPGLAHGSLDLMIAEKKGLVKNKSEKLIFLAIYIIIPFLFFIIWINYPNLVFLLFLVLSGLHFGISDCVSNFKLVEVLTRGIIVITFPFKFHLEETLDVFSYFFVDNNFLLNTRIYFDYLFILLFVLFFILIIKSLGSFLEFRKSFAFIIELIFLLFCFWFFEPLISFFIYFCFLHSTRHLIDEKINLKLNTFQLIIKTLPMTFITLIFFILMFFFFKDDVSGLMINYLVVALSSLTVSHILLVNFTK